MKKLLIPVFTLGFCFGISGMKNSQSATIQFKGNEPHYQDAAFLEFVRNKIKANVAQLLREIPKLDLPEKQHRIYEITEALGIIERSEVAFGQTNLVPGYLEIIECLEKNLVNGNLHSLAGRLYELERALALTEQGYQIIEFGPKIVISNTERNQASTKNAYLLEDIDICAQSADGKRICQEVKSYSKCSDQGRTELTALILGMQYLKKHYGVSCSIYTKYGLPRCLRELCDANFVEYGSDNPGITMKKPSVADKKPFFKSGQSAQNLDCLIDNAWIKITKPTCIVCYQETNPNEREFVEDLEKAHVAYIKSLIKNEGCPADLAELLEQILDQAQAALSGVPGYRTKILESLVASATKQNWSHVKSTAFEMLCALDVPDEKRVLALGAELFFEQSNNPNKGPAFYRVENRCFKEKKELHGNDLDVLLQDAHEPTGYSFIEATTGSNHVKEHKSFRAMAKAMDGEVYVFHDFSQNKTFKRTAYWKRPVMITLESKQLFSLDWSFASRTHGCITQYDKDKNTYLSQSVEIPTSILRKFAKVHSVLTGHPGVQQIATIPDYVYKMLIDRITALFHGIDQINHKADQGVYNKKTQEVIAQLMADDKERNKLGATPFAALVLGHLNLSIPENMHRFIPSEHQYSTVNLNKALDEALKNSIKQAGQINQDPKAQALDMASRAPYNQIDKENSKH